MGPPAGQGFAPGFFEEQRICAGEGADPLTRKRWDETITWMQEKQGLGEWAPAIRNQIPDYREAVQGFVMPAEESQPRTRRMHEYDYPPNPLKPSLLDHPSTGSG